MATSAGTRGHGLDEAMRIRAERRLRVRRAYDHAEVETLSLSRLTRSQPRVHPYWSSTSEAAAELGVTPSAVRQAMLADRLPYVTAPNGRRYVRRHQLDVIANVREVQVLEDVVSSES